MLHCIFILVLLLYYIAMQRFYSFTYSSITPDAVKLKYVSWITIFPLKMGSSGVRSGFLTPTMRLLCGWWLMYSSGNFNVHWYKRIANWKNDDNWHLILLCHIWADIYIYVRTYYLFMNVSSSWVNCDDIN